MFFISDIGQASGVCCTTQINCFLEMIIEYVQFFFLKYFHENRSIPIFGNFVSRGSREVSINKEMSLINFGDDNVKVLSQKVIPWYTHEAIQEFAKFISMGITDSTKKDTIKIKNVTEIMFLKRFPTFNPRLGIVVGKLDFNSIGKMLAFTDSKEPSWKASVLDQALREMSYYPSEDFDLFCKIFQIKADQEKIQDSCLHFIWTDAVEEAPPLFETINMNFLSEIKAVPGLLTDKADVTNE